MSRPATSLRTVRRCTRRYLSTSQERFRERTSGAAGELAHRAGRGAPVRLRVRGWDGGGGQPLRVRAAAGLPLALPRRPRRRLRQTLLDDPLAAGAPRRHDRLFGVRPALRAGRPGHLGRRERPPRGDALARGRHWRGPDTYGLWMLAGQTLHAGIFERFAG